jgi:regulator of protease activity HflC (stomatin/prohibitin superfamily)
MAETKRGINIPQQSVIYIGVCLVGILIFVFWGIIPAERTLAELDTRIEDARYKLEGQKALTPLFQSLQGRSEKKESQVLPLPEQGKLQQTRIDTLPLTFGAAAKASGMTLVSALPNLNALTGDAQFLSVDAVLRGDFIRFRKFLIQIGGLPYVHHIEEITIQGKADMTGFRVKIWVALG